MRVISHAGAYISTTFESISSEGLKEDNEKQEYVNVCCQDIKKFPQRGNGRGFE